MRPGLGRTGIVKAECLEEKDFFKSDKWRTMLAQLWNVREKYIKSLVKKHIWDFSENERSNFKNFHGLHGAFSLNDIGRYRSFSIKGGIKKHIHPYLPKRFSFIPLWVLTLLLFSFIVLIGPAEYVILGKLKLRRFTWISFPITCVAFAILLVVLADSYMGRRHHISMINVIDVGRDNKILRQIEYEIIFSRQQRFFPHRL